MDLCHKYRAPPCLYALTAFWNRLWCEWRKCRPGLESCCDMSTSFLRYDLNGMQLIRGSIGYPYPQNWHLFWHRKSLVNLVNMKFGKKRINHMKKSRRILFTSVKLRKRDTYRWIPSRVLPRFSIQHILVLVRNESAIRVQSQATRSHEIGFETLHNHAAFQTDMGTGSLLQYHNG